jgi:hypothetical protein
LVDAYLLGRGGVCGPGEFERPLAVIGGDWHVAGWREGPVRIWIVIDDAPR